MKAYIAKSDEGGYSAAESAPAGFKISPKKLTFTWPSEADSTFTYDGSEHEILATPVTVNDDEI